MTDATEVITAKQPDRIWTVSLALVAAIATFVLLAFNLVSEISNQREFYGGLKHQVVEQAATQDATVYGLDALSPVFGRPGASTEVQILLKDGNFVTGRVLLDGDLAVLIVPEGSSNETWVKLSDAVQ